MSEQKNNSGNKFIYYILFLVSIIGGSALYFKILRRYQKENPQVTDLAVEPDLLINSAQSYLHDDKKLTAIKLLDEATEFMKLLKNNGDSISVNAIEIAIHDLEAVKSHIKAGDINDKLMYEAFADAMNSLALASLGVSEEFIRKGKKDEADKTLQYAMRHLQNSVKYARGEQREEEIRIVTHLNELIDEHLENDISEIDRVMAKIDSVVKAHVIE